MAGEGTNPSTEAGMYLLDHGDLKAESYQSTLLPVRLAIRVEVAKNKLLLAFFVISLRKREIDVLEQIFGKITSQCCNCSESRLHLLWRESSHQVECRFHRIHVPRYELMIWKNEQRCVDC